MSEKFTELTGEFIENFMNTSTHAKGFYFRVNLRAVEEKYRPLINLDCYPESREINVYFRFDSDHVFHKSYKFQNKDVNFNEVIEEIKRDYQDFMKEQLKKFLEAYKIINKQLYGEEHDQ